VLTDDALIAFLTWDVGRPRDPVPLPQGVPRKVVAHPLAKTPDVPDSFVPKHDRNRDRQKAVVKMDIRAADTRKVDLGDDCPRTGLGHQR
jgi:hypothetical protein